VKIIDVTELDPLSGFDYQVELEGGDVSFSSFRSGVPAWYRRVFRAEAVKTERIWTIIRAPRPVTWGAEGQYRIIMLVCGGADPRLGIPR
jgi:hypothetical protein